MELKFFYRSKIGWNWGTSVPGTGTVPTFAPQYESERVGKISEQNGLKGLQVVQFECPRPGKGKFSQLPLLALWGNKNGLPSMKVKELGKFQNKMGLKGCKGCNCKARSPVSQSLRVYSGSPSFFCFRTAFGDASRRLTRWSLKRRTRSRDGNRNVTYYFWYLKCLWIKSPVRLFFWVFPFIARYCSPYSVLIWYVRFCFPEMH